ncbi:MAG: motility protein A [Minwuia sp.]|uniref:motility protein A n=1 Tax=Minwuia sp. TaxID=2493630 RepID=UPI003A83BD7D
MARFDVATLIGLIAGFGLLIAAILLGDGAGNFVSLPSVLIVLGGTLAVTLVSFNLGDVFRAIPVTFGVAFRRPRDASQAAMIAVKLADEARKQGSLGLPRTLTGVRDEPFLRKALELVADGTPTGEIERILENDMASISTREKGVAQMLRRAAEVAPAMGLIGTLVGLVQMLNRLDSPAEIGPAMALALLTTLYGAVLANMVLNPLATKIERHASDEATLNRLYAAAACSISRKENPRHLETFINSLLPPLKRVRFYAT